MSTRVLVTNDDGVKAIGLRWLARAAHEAGMDVVVAAPDEESSGASSALTAVTTGGRLTIARSSIPDLPVEAYRVRASPAYIVVLAGLGTFGPPPQIVLSGINRGANAGYATLHSGTVGAALTAANHGVTAMAVSLDVLSAVDANPDTGGATLAEAIDAVQDEALHWATAAHLAGLLLPQLPSLPDDTIVNLNVPNRPVDELTGVRMARLAPFGQVQMAIAESGEGYVRTAIRDNSDRRLAGTDLALLADGYATVTPVRSIREAEDAEVDLPLNWRPS